jgi:hypothetical protein
MSKIFMNIQTRTQTQASTQASTQTSTQTQRSNLFNLSNTGRRLSLSNIIQNTSNSTGGCSSCGR